MMKKHPSAVDPEDLPQAGAWFSGEKVRRA